MLERRWKRGGEGWERWVEGGEVAWGRGLVKLDRNMDSRIYHFPWLDSSQR